MVKGLRGSRRGMRLYPLTGADLEIAPTELGGYPATLTRVILIFLMGKLPFIVDLPIKTVVKMMILTVTCWIGSREDRHRKPWCLP